MTNNLEANRLLNYSPKHNCFVITPPKTGSRNLTRILKLFNFYSYIIEDGRLIYVNDSVSHNHTLKLMKNHQDHKIIISCRNPYAIYASLFRLKKIMDKKIRSTFDLKKEFHEFVLEYLFYDTSDPWLERSNNPEIKKLLERKIDYRIKLENFKQSIFQIPFVSESPEHIIDQVSTFANEKFGDHSEIKLFDFAKQFFPDDFRLYYNEDSAQLVYENFKSKFIVMDYEQNSWKF